MQADIYSPILEAFGPKPAARSPETDAMIIAILHELVMSGKPGGEMEKDPMAMLASMAPNSGGNPWLL